MSKKNKKGFTLIELVAVLVIMSIIALIVTPLVMTIIRKARISADKRSVDAYGRSVELAIANYLLDNGDFPTEISQLTIEYSGDRVECSTTQLNSDSTVYLTGCTVAGRSVEGYTYGSNKLPTAVETLLSKANKVNTVDYSSGNRSEMYSFEHPATEQTEALTDYRYIGNTPNNYVYFNDELWRIIGVFPVEDENGNTTSKIKIVRGECLANKMDWDDNHRNNWPVSTLNNYLNNTFYNELSSTSKEMINMSKYYLGSFERNGNYGMPSQIYSNERGLTVYSGNSTYWIGKIGLLYPSDFAYTYALGVDDVCSNNISKCYQEYGANPSTSWINKIRNYDMWLISSFYSTNYNVFALVDEGTIGDMIASNLEVVPTVYLKPEVKIISGLGTQNNPYRLKI